MFHRTSPIVAVLLVGLAGLPAVEAFTLTAAPSLLWRFLERSGGEISPMLLADLPPAPLTWAGTGGEPIELAGGTEAQRLRLESAHGELLLEVRGFDDGADRLEYPRLGAIPPSPVRLVLRAGSAPLNLPHSRLTFLDQDGLRRSILVPAARLRPSQSAAYWVSDDGRSFPAHADDRRPDFDRAMASAPQPPWAVLDAAFRLDVVATDLQLPVGIAFVPRPGRSADDPFFYVSELHGTIKVVSRAGAVGVYAAGLLNFQPETNFPGSGERGLTGIAVDPANGDLFACLVDESISEPGTFYPRIVRLVSTDGGRTAASVATVLEMPGAPQGPAHQISSIAFGPDGRLYVHVGDGYQTFFSQFLDSFLGKILRLERNGSPAADNPFYDAGNGIGPRDYVYAYGLRNPFGGAFRAEDGALYQVENGPSVDRLAKVPPGRNFLWAGSNANMQAFAIYNWSPAAAPVNLAFVQVETFGGSGFPIAMRDYAFVTESGPTYATGPQLRGKRISAFALGLNETLISGPTAIVEYTGSGKASAAALAAGPDGLYFSDLYPDDAAAGPTGSGARILRLRNVVPPLSTMRMQPDGPTWDALPATPAYDVVRGSLETLRSSFGDLGLAVTTCLAENLGDTHVEDIEEPLPGAGFWYLVRGLDSANRGSYESAGVSQVGLRDLALESAALACY